MAITPEEIEHLIKDALPEAHVLVQSEDGHHFAAEVVAPAFKGLNRVQQQRLVNAALKARIDSGDLHALALTTRAPD